MAEVPKEDPESEQIRDGQGRFKQKVKTEGTEQNQPKSSDYTKMNSFMAKQLGMTEKLADLQTQYEPQELFKRLSFMSENSTIKTTAQGGLPPNQKIAAISPEPEKAKLPGTLLSKPNLTKDGFSVSYSINPRDLLQPKKKE